MSSGTIPKEQMTKRVWSMDVRTLGVIAAATTAVTLAFMQVEGPAPKTGNLYHSPDWAIALHVGTVIPALVIGLLVLTRRKGGVMHRRLGTVWMGMMVTTAISSFWIRGEGGGMSGIHLFSIGTLIAVPMAIWRARVRDIRTHQQIAVSLYIGLIVAGIFALDPNRIAGHFVWRLLLDA
jgi:uncharacterized membrane protein